MAQEYLEYFSLREYRNIFKLDIEKQIDTIYNTTYNMNRRYKNVKMG